MPVMLENLFPRFIHIPAALRTAVEQNINDGHFIFERAVHLRIDRMVEFLEKMKEPCLLKTFKIYILPRAATPGKIPVRLRLSANVYEKVRFPPRHFQFGTSH